MLFNSLGLRVAGLKDDCELFCATWTRPEPDFNVWFKSSQKTETMPLVYRVLGYIMALMANYMWLCAESKHVVVLGRSPLREVYLWFIKHLISLHLTVFRFISCEMKNSGNMQIDYIFSLSLSHSVPVNLPQEMWG